jgi:hypothetical protein
MERRKNPHQSQVDKLFPLFPWLKQADTKLYCGPCRTKFGVKNAHHKWAQGKEISTRTTLDREKIRKHVKSDGHKEALKKEAKASQKTFLSVLPNLEMQAQKNREKDSLSYKLCAMLMRFVGINNDALKRFTALIALQQDIFKVVLHYFTNVLCVAATSREHYRFLRETEP